MSLLRDLSNTGKLRGYFDELVTEIEDDLECNVVSINIVMEDAIGVCVATMRTKGE